MTYFQHKTLTVQGKAGTITKVSEEYEELMDAHSQEKPLFCIIESADIINALGQFTFWQYRVPLIFVVLLCYLRKPYKWTRRLLLGPKEVTNEPYYDD